MIKQIPVNNKELREEIAKAQQSRKQSNKLGLIIYTIATKTMGRREFRQYTVYGNYMRDCIESATMLKLVEVVYKFKLERKTSAFSYFLVCAYCAIVNEIKKNNTQNKIKRTSGQTTADYGKFYEDFYDDLAKQGQDAERVIQQRFGKPRSPGRPKNIKGE